MSTVTITLEDDDSGHVVQTVSYGEKFDVKSNAHQFAGIMIKLTGEFLSGGQTIPAPAAEPTSLIVLG